MSSSFQVLQSLHQSLGYCTIGSIAFLILLRSRYLSFFSFSFSFTLWSAGTAKFTIYQVLFVFADYYKVWSSGRDYGIRLYHKIPEELVRRILQDRFWIVHIPFVCMAKLQFLAQFPVDHLARPVVSSLVTFCANLLYSLILWLIVSSLLPHNLHLLCCCSLSIHALIWFVLTALFCCILLLLLLLLLYIYIYIYIILYIYIYIVLDPPANLDIYICVCVWEWDSLQKPHIDFN